MKKIVCVLLLTTIFMLGCGSANSNTSPNNTSASSNRSSANSTNSNINEKEEVRLGTYQMDRLWFYINFILS